MMMLMLMMMLILSSFVVGSLARPYLRFHLRRRSLHRARVSEYPPTLAGCANPLTSHIAQLKPP